MSISTKTQIKTVTNDTNIIDFSSCIVGGQKSLDPNPIPQVNVKTRPTVKPTSMEKDVEARTKEAEVAGTTVTTGAALEANEAASVDHSTQAQHSLSAQGANHSTPANNFIKKSPQQWWHIQSSPRRGGH